MEDIILKIRGEKRIRNCKVIYSKVVGRGGRIAAYVSPARDCFNRTRKVNAFTGNELTEKIEKCIDKWYSPVIYYQIDGHLIGSNSKENVLKEYWRVCDKIDIGRHFKVEIHSNG